MTLTITKDQLIQEWGLRITTTSEFILRAVQYEGFLNEDNDETIVHLSNFISNWRYLYSDDKGNPKDKMLNASDVSTFLIKKSDPLGIKVDINGDKLILRRNDIQGRSLADVLDDAFDDSDGEVDPTFNGSVRYI